MKAPGRPLVVSYGMGVDSTAMLVWMHQRGVRPDAILFADTGGEKPETYAYLDHMNHWLASVDCPRVTVVTKPGQARRSKHKTLEQNCVENETLPSLAFGYKSCSLKWKATPMDQWVSRWQPAQDAWARGEKVVRAIGYDASPADLRRSKIKETSKFTYWYPLRDAGITRPGCKELIESAGLPVPMKSSCFFCPAMHREEVVYLAEHHPDLLRRALDMEEGARDGKHGLKTTKGIGRSWSWTKFVADELPDYGKARCVIG